MSRVVATAGKGGTGKTTTAAVLVRCLVESGARPILAVDADANANLGEMLGIRVDRTLGTMREGFMEERAQVPSGMTKEALLEMRLADAIVEGDEVDMLVMGRPEGTGCYCAVNNVLRAYMEKLAGNYQFVVMDNEAGLEHMSRRTTRSPDVLIVVSDHGRRGIEAARRIHDLAREIGVGAGTVGLVINRVPPGGPDPRLEEMAQGLGMPILAMLPEDADIARFDLEHRSVFEIPEGNPFLAAVRVLAAEVA